MHGFGRASEHFTAFYLELPPGSKRNIPAGVQFGALGHLIPGKQKLRENEPATELLGIECYSELNRYQSVRLSHELAESSAYSSGASVRVLRKICLVANFSEEFFLSDCRDRWLRTAIICDKGDPNALFCSEVQVKDLDSLSRKSSSSNSVSITIHSKVVPNWPNLQAVRDGAVRRRLCFPSTFLDVAVSENRSLEEWKEEWHKRDDDDDDDDDDERDQHKNGTPFWNVESDDVVVVKSDNFGKGSQAIVGKILWRGGIFARKVFKQEEEFYKELDVVRRVSHPHIVYSFGLSISADEKKQERQSWYNKRPFVSKKSKRKQEQDESKQHSLLMELLDTDLFLLIRERVRVVGRSKPPFSHRDSVHILLQVAIAMTFMHGLPEPVIHGDLKSPNILVSHCEGLGDVCQYFVKVADFGSARIKNSSSTFRPDKGTTKYAAPEVLIAHSETLEIRCPQKIDVYSFGIIAFEVLSGLEPYKESPSILVAKEGVAGLVPYEGVSSRQEFKKGVIAGTLRPPLREACSRPDFWNDLELLALVESCWDPEPSNRPHFTEVARRLETIYNDLNQKQTDGLTVDPPSQASSGNDAPQASSGNDAPQAMAVDDAPQPMSVDDAPQAMAVDDAPQAMAVDDAPQAMAVDDAPQGMAVDDAPQPVSVDDALQNNAAGTSSRPSLEYLKRHLQCGGLFSVKRKKGI